MINVVDQQIIHFGKDHKIQIIKLQNQQEINYTINLLQTEGTSINTSSI